MTVVESNLVADGKTRRVQKAKQITAFIHKGIREARELDLAAWPNEGEETAEFQAAMSTLLDKVEELTSAQKDSDPTKRRRNRRGTYETSAKVLLCNILANPFTVGDYFRWRSSTSATALFRSKKLDNPSGVKATNLAMVIRAAAALGWIGHKPYGDNPMSVERAMGPFQTRSKREKNPASRFKVYKAAPFLSDTSFIGFHPEARFVVKSNSSDKDLPEVDHVELEFTVAEDEADQELLTAYNEIVKGLTIRDKGGRVRPHARPLRRHSNGRFYGGFWQNMPRDERPDLTINGEPIAELDFSATFPRLLYHMQGEAYLDAAGGHRDPYEMGEGLDRQQWKRLFVIALNTDSMGRGCNALHKLFCDEYGWDKKHWPAHIMDIWGRREALFRHLLEFHKPIAHKLFDKNVFTELTRHEASIARQIIRGVLSYGRETGQTFPLLPIHDSFIVPAREKDHLRSVMRMVYRDMIGFDPRIDQK